MIQRTQRLRDPTDSWFDAFKIQLFRVGPCDSDK